MNHCASTAILLAVLALLRSACCDELAPPVKLTVGGEPIDVMRTGHSAPWYGDFDGDGRHDLLVGEYYEGRCRVFLNRGTNDRPEFGDFQWFEAGGELARVPTG